MAAKQFTKWRIVIPYEIVRLSTPKLDVRSSKESNLRVCPTFSCLVFIENFSLKISKMNLTLKCQSEQSDVASLEKRTTV